ncbi:MAG TPA: metalloregulator ArsR/SmtB family transcription factor [Candidatus Acidoferrales bacterium]|nr:metalloregulator ArsR/SmtB family transcription factor [Candidatus Acidoferrales bacterium]
MCKVFSSPKRLQIIDLLRDGERTVGELVRYMGVGKANLSQQLSFMRSKGILETRRDGQRIYYRLAYPGMLKAYDLLRELLFNQLEAQGSMARKLRQAAGGRSS